MLHVRKQESTRRPRGVESVSLSEPVHKYADAELTHELRPRYFQRLMEIEAKATNGGGSSRRYIVVSTVRPTQLLDEPFSEELA